MNKIVAVDCYLSHNLGDDLFLFTLLKRYPNVMFNVNADCSYGYLTHDFNNANLVISGSNSDSGSLLLKMKRYCSNICEYLTELHNADALVTIGGSLYMENENRTLRAVVAEKRRFFRDKRNARKAAKYYVLGANFGPFYSKRYLSFYKKFFSNYCQDVCFRDRYSASLFSDVSNVRYAPDILFNVELPKVVRRKKLFISVVDLNQVNKFKNLSKKRLAYDQLIMKYIRKYDHLGYDIVLCSFSCPEGDEYAVRRLMQCAKSERIAVRTLYYWNNIQEVLTELASSNTVIGTRFHAVILGLLAGAEVLPIMYSNKTGYVLDDLGFDMAHAIDLKSENWMHYGHKLPNPIAWNVSSSVVASAEQFSALDTFLGE